MGIHGRHSGKSLVTGVCKGCYQTFYRDGDLMSISVAYASQSRGPEITLDNVKTYIDWLIAAGEYCDGCLPPMPWPVRQDINKENDRRQQDLNRYSQNKDVFPSPGHESKTLASSSIPSEIITKKPQDVKPNAPIPKKNHLNKIGKAIPNPMRKSKKRGPHE